MFVPGGGQRARIGLARALYRDADLVLLDDPLSAVDSKVARLLFESAIQDMCVARGKCVVLATHQYQLIANETCILMKRGSIIEIAPYANCINQSEGLLKSTVKIEGSKFQSESSNEISDLNAKFTDVPAAPKQRESCEQASKDHDEQKSTGEISMRTWKDYIAALGGKWVVMGILSLFACAQGVLLLTLALIGRWSQSPFDDQSSPNFVVAIVLLGVTVIVLSFVRSVVAFNRAIRASRNLHDSMTLAVLRAKIEFFDTNPLGRILNRFSSDIGSNDDQLPTSLNDTVSIGFIVVGAIASAAAVMPFILIAVPPIFCYFFRIRRMFIGASRELKRFEGMARSPIYGMMSESINGISSIRANGAVEYFQTQFAEVQNAHSRAFFSFIACTRWINFRMEAIQICLLSVASLLAVFFHAMNWFYLDPTILGLSLTLLLQLSGLLQWAVRQSCEVISQMVAVERVAAYSKLEPEAPLETEADALLDASWPTHGAIAVDDLTVRYRETLQPALSGLTFDAKGGLRIGVVGRTGSGKSTLLQALFRLLEAEQGDIKIDKQDISRLGLHTLRKRMSVIPQTPVLFSGWSLRDNLDPFRAFGDREIVESLSNVQLQDIYDELPEGLETVVADNGNNFSVGQRQLLCVARAILQKNKILVLDEPTANVDQRTDALLQEAVATSFPGATVIAIAHRLDTVIDYDLILVIGDGKLLEYGSPMELLQQDGHFTAMVADTGPSMSKDLHVRASAVSAQTGV
jgi:ATP-binding cassette, subfamily C (CFTR/MRP), member 4